MKNYLRPLGQFVNYQSIIIPGILLMGINIGLLAAFLVCFMLFSFLQNELLGGLSYPVLPAIAVLFFVIASVKLWYDFGILIKEKVKEKPKKEKIKESLIIDFIGLLPLLFLVLLNNVIVGLKRLANPGSVTGEFLANTVIVIIALVIQVLIVESAVFSKKSEAAQEKVVIPDEKLT
ncbi:hypothetical protein KKD19_05275 [Patescibacteria group bacterium]|nr:hypothetical protein [Patescibacteria group bacterium]MBU4512618.1 hypothetical protein [Patescibacteria group bacterium]MCG2693333.1 hypothetical protein [Candidatus Parcubacteria bacterium]